MWGDPVVYVYVLGFRRKYIYIPRYPAIFSWISGYTYVHMCIYTCTMSRDFSKDLTRLITFLGPCLVIVFFWKNAQLFMNACVWANVMSIVNKYMSKIPSSFVWPSVLLKCSSEVLKRRRVVKYSWEDRFGMILKKLD